MARNLFIVFVLLCMTSCISMMAPNPVYVQQIDSYFNAAKQDTYATSEKFQRPIPYEVGQYVVTGSTHDSKRSVSKMSIVGKEGNGWILELYSLTPTSESVTQMKVVGMDTVHQTGAVEEIDFIWIKIKPDGEPVQTIEGALLTMTKGIYKKALSGLAFQLKMASAGGTVRVPAGKFNGAVKAVNHSSLLGKKYHADVWLHPSVPINGILRSIHPKEDLKIELLDFGLSGARKSF